MSGRRDRNKQDKRDRILAAARDLFAERGFSGVTTQQISERADVAAGTLFRYAATKGELILMVENDAFAASVDGGIARARAIADPAEAVFALVEPVLALAERNAENTMAYQRELLFGGADEPHRQEGIAVIVRLEEAVAALLPVDHAAAYIAARSVFAVLHLALVSASLTPVERTRSVRLQIQQIVRGATASEERT
ncbi:TetR/AcrR family transcriptional regulator [Microbacterium sp. GXS0129]|uniref:TetR/AcrR family transcriptional regulator n=1 Tax=Microbacterium sp. GXS0129 TaxID=3377836 RepID=UPI00383BBEE9